MIIQHHSDHTHDFNNEEELPNNAGLAVDRDKP